MPRVKTAAQQRSFPAPMGPSEQLRGALLDLQAASERLEAFHARMRAREAVLTVINGDGEKPPTVKLLPAGGSPGEEVEFEALARRRAAAERQFHVALAAERDRITRELARLELEGVEEVRSLLEPVERELFVLAVVDRFRAQIGTLDGVLDWLADPSKPVFPGDDMRLSNLLDLRAFGQFEGRVEQWAARAAQVASRTQLSPNENNERGSHADW